jgi:hypothetical protein
MLEKLSFLIAAGLAALRTLFDRVLAPMLNQIGGPVWPAMSSFRWR